MFYYSSNPDNLNFQDNFEDNRNVKNKEVQSKRDFLDDLYYEDEPKDYIFSKHSKKTQKDVKNKRNFLNDLYYDDE